MLVQLDFFFRSFNPNFPAIYFAVDCSTSLFQQCWIGGEWIVVFGKNGA